MADSKKINPFEKAGISGVASGATIEGLSALMGAETKCSLKGMFHINYHNFYQKADYGPFVRNVIDGEVSLKLSYGKASERQIENYIQNALTDLKWIMKECESTGNYGGGKFVFKFWKLEDCEAFATQFPKYCRVKINSSPIDNKNKYPDTASLSEDIEKHGEASCEFEVDYRPDRDGKSNETGMKRLNKVCSVLGIEDREYIPKEYVHPYSSEESLSAEGDDELSEKQLKDYFARLKDKNPKLAKEIEISIKDQSYLPPHSVINKAGFDYEIIEAWADLVAEEDKYAPFERCDECEGEGYILTSYTSATRFDPADGDGEDCGVCGGTGEIDPADYMYSNHDGQVDYLAETFEASGCVGCQMQKPVSKEERAAIQKQVDKFNEQLALDPDDDFERYILIDLDDEALIEDAFFSRQGAWKPLTEAFRKRWGNRSELMDKISLAQVGEKSNYSIYSFEKPFWFEFECDPQDTATAEDPEGYGLGFEFDMTKEEAIEKARQIHKETKGAITMYNTARKRSGGGSTRIHPKFWTTPEMMEEQKEYYKREDMEWPTGEWLDTAGKFNAETFESDTLCQGHQQGGSCGEKSTGQCMNCGTPMCDEMFDYCDGEWVCYSCDKMGFDPNDDWDAETESILKSPYLLGAGIFALTLGILSRKL